MIEKTRNPLLSLNRRHLLQTGILGIAAMGTAGAAKIMTATGFTHGVASGEPGPDNILLWTRYVGRENGTKLRAELATDIDFNRIISAGDIIARPERDHIAKITLSGLNPGQYYFYRFVAEDGTISDIGRTRTLPSGHIDEFNLAVFSCANMPFGWFNAYGHANERNDVHLVMMLGDYLYEYNAGTYPSVEESVPGRILQPAGELIALADYRLRYATYRADRDLQRLHQIYPVVAMWDDHEFANDAWAGGAQNHQEDEGNWGVRKRAAEQVWREWMPVRDIDDDIRWSRYQIGDLATIHMTESRIGARSEQVEFKPVKGDQASQLAAIKDFRDNIWQDDSRQMLGRAQEKWLFDGFQNTISKWNVWAQQTIVGQIKQADGLTELLRPEIPDFITKRVKGGETLSKFGLPSNMDAWDGYPAARMRALSAAQSGNADLIVLTGDSHNSWAFNLPADGQPAGVEFAGHSVSSPGLEAYFGDSNRVANIITTANPQLQWMNADKRGYMTVTLTPDHVTNIWHMLETVRSRNITVSGNKKMTVLHGKRMVENG